MCGKVVDFGRGIRETICRREKSMNINIHQITRREFVRSLAIAVAASAVATSTSAQSLDLPPIVSCDWLANHLENPNLIVLDIRNGEQYKKGHIPGSFNVPLSLWAVSRNGLTLELPPDDALRDLIGKSGITPDSKIVVVNRVDTDFSRADMTRVAWTVAVAGVQKVAVLDGGYNRWIRDKKSVSSEIANPKSGIYSGKMNLSLFASKNHVLSKIGKSIIVDTRVPEEYFGIAPIPGHIRGSVNLPTPWVFNNDGTYRKEDDLRAMAAGVIGLNKSKEVILYCGVGGFSATWWFLLTRILGYKDVRVYDGSMEEWSKDPAAPVTTYSWH
jgi:thiosulfate/3-mercaptopyruvate sulfurtransferase